VLEGLNSASTTYYFYWLYFFMERVFGFGNQANLELAALNGLICVFAAWQGGRFAQRYGYLTALKFGFAIMLVAMLVGPHIVTARGQIVVAACTAIGMCFTWATLEALVSENETPLGLQRMVGIYNVVWAATGAVAYFAGGAMLDRLGMASIFYVPAGILALQLALTFWLESLCKSNSRMVGTRSTASVKFADGMGDTVERVPATKVPLNPRPIAKTRMFLRLAWLANPFAYIGINTLLALMPGLAKRFELSTTLAGFCCSLWCFARLGGFFGFWIWSGWHYRFHWLVAAFAAMIGAFLLILLVPNLAVFVLAQLLFGGALGLIYYSSLFYSMDISETKSEHGGIHEAAIGLGNFVGPAIGATFLHFLPEHPDSGGLAVAGLLVVGLLALGAVWRTRSRP
jgi:predicted MFS family arabinose efflux permease